jgi:hypothetical protein
MKTFITIAALAFLAGCAVSQKNLPESELTPQQIEKETHRINWAAIDHPVRALRISIQKAKTFGVSDFRTQAWLDRYFERGQTRINSQITEVMNFAHWLPERYPAFLKSHPDFADQYIERMAALWADTQGKNSGFMSDDRFRVNGRWVYHGYELFEVQDKVRELLQVAGAQTGLGVLGYNSWRKAIKAAAADPEHPKTDDLSTPVLVIDQFLSAPPFSVSELCDLRRLAAREPFYRRWITPRFLASEQACVELGVSS